MKSLILILQFLTKLPLPFKIDAEEKDFSKGIIWFPLAGAIIGLLMYAVYEGAILFVTPFVASVIVVSFEIFITGGLHLDGLADTFDGLYSYRDKKRMLEIMKDSRVGTNGVLILVVNILLKVALLSSVPNTLIFPVLLLMPTSARLMGVVLARVSKYAREKGMGGFFIEKTSTIQVVLATLMTLLLFMVDIKALIILPIMLAVTFIFKWHVYAKIDGITGDVLGAWIEMSEVLFLFCMIIRG